MKNIVQVRLREHGKVEYFDQNEKDVASGDLCVVEVDHGRDYGTVVSNVEIASKEEEEESRENLKKILRRANFKDVEQIEKNRRDLPGAIRKCAERVHAHNLPMKIVAGEYSLDRSKIVFYFTADGRVDFRELVKDLAAVFKARIELRQIGVRDEAKIIGGLGVCGRVQCCCLFMKSFDSINIRMAKCQRLPLNPSKIFGPCGRLLCCLKYEHQLYKERLKNMPKDGSIVSTRQGEGRVTDLNVLKQTVMVMMQDDRVMELPVSEVRVIEGKQRDRR